MSSQEGHLATTCPFPKKKRKRGKAGKNTGVFIEGLPKGVGYSEVEEVSLRQITPTYG